MDDLPIPAEGEQTLLKRSLPFKRRTEPRYRCPLAMMARLRAPAATPPLDETVWLVNLSCHGVGFVRAEPIDADVVVTLKLPDALSRLPWAAVVMHSTRQANGDYLVGCRLAEPLTEEALEQLLDDEFHGG